MRLKLLVVFILCLSAFASSKNECAHPLRDSGTDHSSSSGCTKGSPSKEVSKETSEDKGEFSTFQLVKFLYI
jgi:hypothetical protein